MALRKLLTKRFFEGTKTTMPFEHKVVSSPPLQQAVSPPSAPQPSSTADGGFLRQFFFRRAVYHSAPTRLPEVLTLPVGERLREKLKGINSTAGDRLRLGGVAPAEPGIGMSANDARKILRATQMEKVKARLRNVSESSIPFSEFLRICVEACENREQGAEFAKILDDSGNVIVLGNAVFLRPEQVAKSIESLIYQSIANPNDPRRKELEQMEKQKGVIDDKAKAQVRAELYFGLGFLTVQTLGFMRLTFWELSWDVMEPICFFTTSMGFALAYLFFLKTSAEPTFQGFFYYRFKVKQERLMKTHNFNMSRYNELCKACYPSYHHGGVNENSEPSPSFHHHPGEAHVRALHR
ncbi:calcium uniporter protein 4, mitochondrial [Cajanus cajan]|uniref:calcium uniporter protein 4, mitochondrial n=1 Tax=Cajanus cajan TaxID=3821 RepID=UPI00098DD0B7|nr:calcium uniporter protein 4, mitochondrial [Cajanus cajan]